MRTHFQGSLSHTACGRRIGTPEDFADERGKFWVPGTAVTDEPKQVTCKRCLETHPSHMER